LNQDNESRNEVPEKETRKRGRGFRTMIIAVICVLAVGGTLIAMNGERNFRNNEPLEEQIPPVGDSAPQKDLELDVLQPIPTTDSREEKPSEENKEPASQKAPAEEKISREEGLFYRPVLGKVTNDFSVAEPIYSKTLDQYMVHTGVDIEAEEDSQVKAVAPGTVTAVFEDDKLGTTIQILHENGLVTQYSNLSSGVLVEEGDVVERSQVIGGVGRSALFESLEPPHLHFEVLKDGQPADPNEYVNF